MHMLIKKRDVNAKPPLEFIPMAAFFVVFGPVLNE